jgi:signal peptidase II
VIKRWIVLLIVVATGISIDQYTKYLAHTQLYNRGIVPLIEGFFDLRYSRNPGIFFGLGSQISDNVRLFLLIGGTLLAIGLIVALFKKTQAPQRFLRWALMLLLSGACGNLIDRVLEGEVVDFLHLHWREVFHWATFNVADILIVIGLVLLFIDMFQKRQFTSRESSHSEPSE